MLPDALHDLYYHHEGMSLQCTQRSFSLQTQEETNLVSLVEFSDPMYTVCSTRLQSASANFFTEESSYDSNVHCRALFNIHEWMSPNLAALQQLLHDLSADQTSSGLLQESLDIVYHLLVALQRLPCRHETWYSARYKRTSTIYTWDISVSIVTNRTIAATAAESAPPLRGRRKPPAFARRR